MNDFNSYLRKKPMHIIHLQPLISLIAGILILIFPRFLNYVVAIYLIINGILELGIIRF